MIERRRAMMANAMTTGGSLTLSEDNISVNASSANKTVTVYLDEEILKDSEVEVTKSGSCVSSATYSSSTGKVTITISSNNSLNDTRSGIVVVSYKGQEAICSISQDVCVFSHWEPTEIVSLGTTASGPIFSNLSFSVDWDDKRNIGGPKFSGFNSFSFQPTIKFQKRYTGSYNPNQTTNKTFPGYSGSFSCTADYCGVFYEVMNSGVYYNLRTRSSYPTHTLSTSGNYNWIEVADGSYYCIPEIELSASGSLNNVTGASSYEPWGIYEDKKDVFSGTGGVTVSIRAINVYYYTTTGTLNGAQSKRIYTDSITFATLSGTVTAYGASYS